MDYCIWLLFFFFFFNDTATTEIYTLSLHDALPISNLGELARVKKNPFALGALVHHDVPLDAPEVPHHDDAGIAWAIASLLRVQLDRGVLLDVQQRFPRRLVRLVDLAERPFVEPQPAAATLASLDLHVAHRNLRHRRAAGWTVHRDDSFARVFKVSDNPNGSSTRCATSRPSRTGITDAIQRGSA